MRADELELWRRWRDDRDQDARQAIVIRNQPLVRMVASRMPRRLQRRIGFEELVQMGSLGLLYAVDRFDPAQTQFSTYAVQCIHGYLCNGLNAESWVKRAGQRKDRQRRESGLPSERKLMLSNVIGHIDDERFDFDKTSPDLKRVEQVEEARRLMKPLKKREAIFVLLYYYEDWSMREIGEHFGISRNRVCQVMERAIQRMQEVAGVERAQHD